MARYVISDIHGCSKTLKALIQMLNPSKQDLLCFLGDYIDKGPDSSGVLDYIIHLQESGYQMHMLIGNHEKNMLAAEAEYDTYSFFKYAAQIAKSPDVVDLDGKIKPRYKQFFNTLLYYLDLGDVLLVHAGFDFAQDDIFADKTAMLELRQMDYNLQKAKGKRIIHGHQVTYLAQIRKALKLRNMVIPLDNGCVYTRKHRYYDFTQLGTLCAFEIDKNQLYLQPNIES